MIEEYVPRDPREMLEEELLRELIERYADLMPVLGRLDIDVDSLAGRTLAEVARIHGYEPGPILDEAIKAMSVERR
jgi:hypothetical protein